MPTWMILGGGGVFGVHLAAYLLTNDRGKVVSVGRNPRPAAPWNLGLSDANWRYEQIHILHEPKRLQMLIMDAKPDYIVNFAAQAYATSWQDSDSYYQTNLVALARLTEWLGISHWTANRDWKFIQIGTSELYGSCDEPATESHPLRPTSPYAVSKMAADLHLQTLKNFPAIILRPSNAYGEAQQLYRLIPRAIYSALKGTKFSLNGGGLAEKSYIHAEDLARAVVTVGEKGEVGQVYNCGPSHAISIRDLVDVIATQFGFPVSQIADIAPPRANEDNRYLLDSSRIAELGWQPKIELLEGIDRMIKWTRRNLNVLPPPREFVLRT